MWFGIVRWMRQVDGFEDWSTGGGNLGGEYGAPYRKQCGICRMAIREPSELQFGVMGGVIQGLGGNAACSQITLGHLVVFFMLMFSYYFAAAFWLDCMQYCGALRTVHRC